MFTIPTRHYETFLRCNMPDLDQKKTWNINIEEKYTEKNSGVYTLIIPIYVYVSCLELKVYFNCHIIIYI